MPFPQLGRTTGSILIDDTDAHTGNFFYIEAFGSSATVTLVSSTLKLVNGNNVSGFVLADGRHLYGIFSSVTRTAGTGVIVAYAA